MNISESNARRESSFIESVNPATLESVGRVEATDPEQVEQHVRTARQGYLEWRSVPIKKRAAVLKRAQALMLQHAEDLARTITLEMGRPFTESMVLELQSTADLTGYYAAHARRFLNERRIPLHNVFFMMRKSRIHFEPLGVMGIITPWNWPLLIPMGCIVPALLAGNAVVFKPSEQTPMTGSKIRDLFVDAGVPDAAFQVVQGKGAVGAALVHSSVEKIFFTGSTEVGQRVMEGASRSWKKAVLELGGSDPAIVCDDADLDITSSGIVWGGFSNCGQNCNGIERVYVQDRVWDPFLQRVIEKMKRLRVGNGMDPGTDIGPLASHQQVLKMESIVRHALKQGAELLLGGKRVPELAGHFFEPTLLHWPGSLQAPFQEEIFGPVMMVTPFHTDQEAACLANHSPFGLAASVWTENKRRGEALARQLESGTVMINDAIVSFGIAEAGWTGIKKSGVGWVHGEKGLDEMVNIKYVNRDPLSRTQKFWWFPYTPAMMQGIKSGMAFLYGTGVLKKLRLIPGILKFFTGYLAVNRGKEEKW